MRFPRSRTTTQSRRIVTLDTHQGRADWDPRTVLVARAADRDPDTTEIRALAAAAGYDVVEAITQRRREDPTYGVGRGAAETVARRVADLDADAIVYDGSLSPGQTFSLGDLLPDGVSVVDRPRLVLGLIAEGSASRAATLRFELAIRRYELPRLREIVGRDGHARRLRPEGAGRVQDLERQVDTLEARLQARESPDSTKGEGRAVAARDGDAPGPSRVAVVGYANAGKSLLCHRLESRAPDQPAATESDAVTDRPLTTAGTSTTTVTLAGRRLRLTDTTGIVAGLPEEALGAFDRTRDVAREAAVTLLVINVSTASPSLSRRLVAVVDTLGGRLHDVIPVLTHVDQLPAQNDAGEDAGADCALDASPAGPAATRVAAVAEELTAVGVDSRCDPILVDVCAGTGVDAVSSAIVDALPTATEVLTVEHGGDTQATLSWAYDRDLVVDVSYGEDGIDVTLAGRPDAVAAAVRRFER